MKVNKKDKDIHTQLVLKINLVQGFKIGFEWINRFNKKDYFLINSSCCFDNLIFQLVLII